MFIKFTADVSKLIVNATNPGGLNSSALTIVCVVFKVVLFPAPSLIASTLAPDIVTVSPAS